MDTSESSTEVGIYKLGELLGILLVMKGQKDQVTHMIGTFSRKIVSPLRWQRRKSSDLHPGDIFGQHYQSPKLTDEKAKRLTS
jgi:hypothetical protein